MNAAHWSSGLLAVLLAVIVVPAHATENACAPVIESAWVRAAPPGAESLAAYLELRNPCTTAVTVVAAESRDFAMAMIHRTDTDADMSRMRVAGNLELAPGQVLHFAPAGMHVMLMQPSNTLHEGDTVELTLRLADDRTITQQVPVRREAPQP